jgi:hypothetical protein
MEYLNPVLLLILVAEASLGACAWRSPRFLRRVAAHLLTRADVVEVSRAESMRRMEIWMDELGVNREPANATASCQPPIHRFSRDEVEVS